MNKTQLPSDIHFIQRGWFHCNHVVVQDPDGPIIIDTGQHTGVEDTVALLQERGIDPTAIQLIINTHCHTDHWGGNARLQALSGAPVICGPKTAEIFANGDTRAMWVDYFGMAESYELPSPMILPSKIIAPGDSIQLGRYSFQILAAPGHAPDSIALFEPKYGILLCADAMFEQDCGVMNSKVSGEKTLDEALTTLARFKELDATIALPGHGPIITDVAENIEAVSHLIRLFQRRSDKHARHLCARAFAFSLLILQPIPRTKFLTMFEEAPWLHDNAAILGIPKPTDLLAKLTEEFIQRGLVQDNHGILTSTIPL